MSLKEDNAWNVLQIDFVTLDVVTRLQCNENDPPSALPQAIIPRRSKGYRHKRAVRQPDHPIGQYQV